MELFRNCHQLITSIQCILGEIWSIRYTYRGRDCNACADQMARKAVDSGFNFTILFSPPIGLKEFLDLDSNPSSAASSSNMQFLFYFVSFARAFALLIYQKNTEFNTITQFSYSHIMIYKLNKNPLQQLKMVTQNHYRSKQESKNRI